ncbi:MAG: heliorhodopsin HeR [Actinomycetes bacterium]
MAKELSAPRLRRFNVIAGSFHLLQMIAVIALANDFSLPVQATYMSGPPGSTFAPPTTLFSVLVGPAVALFLGISALAHFIVASPKFFPRYAAGLEAKRNNFRWVEYSVSSSVMIVLISQICGVADVTALLAIFGVNAAMILFGWLQEKYAQPGNGEWLPFIFGCIVGIVPWLAVAIYVFAPGSPSEVSAPGFVYGIVISLFAFFNSFAAVQLLQYRGRGKWGNYLRGERTYIVLSLVAKSALAWQIFAGTLAA